MLDFDLPYAMLTLIAGMVRTRVFDYIARMDDAMGMLYSTVCWLAPKLIKVLNRMRSEGEPEIPPTPAGQDPVLHITMFILEQLPQNMAGLTLRGYVDAAGDVVKLEATGSAADGGPAQATP